MLCLRACCLKSGPASMSILMPFASMKADVRRRLSRASLDLQTSQLQPRRGTPKDVPVPKNVICMIPL